MVIIYFYHVVLQEGDIGYLIFGIKLRSRDSKILLFELSCAVC